MWIKGFVAAAPGFFPYRPRFHFGTSFFDQCESSSVSCNLIFKNSLSVFSSRPMWSFLDMRMHCYGSSVIGILKAVSLSW